MTEHFALAEFHSHDGVEVPDFLRDNVRRLAEQLEVLRASLGGRPIKIMSGYRSPEHNKAVGGAKHSQHVLGRAADIQVRGLTSHRVWLEVLQLIREGRMTQGGVGLYATFVHYDIRGRSARWQGK